MRIQGISRASLLRLGFVVAAAAQGLAAETILVDGSNGVMHLAAALAEAYRERQPAVTVEMGKGLGTRARLEALAAGKIDIALASHGVDVEELTRQGMAVHEITKVAVVFGVNASVPVAGLTPDAGFVPDHEGDALSRGGPVSGVHPEPGGSGGHRRQRCRAGAVGRRHVHNRE